MKSYQRAATSFGRALGLAAIGGLALVALGCEDDNNAPKDRDANTADAAPDTPPDTKPDTLPDTKPDTPPDTTPDTTEDTAPDTTPDTTEDTAPDTTPDTTEDTTPDTTPDTIEEDPGPPECTNANPPECTADGVFRRCDLVTGKWVEEDCKATGKYCEAEHGGCTAICHSDEACENYKELDGEYCDSKGKCKTKVFETVWQTELENEFIQLPYLKPEVPCDFYILWGDQKEGIKLKDGTHITDCKNENNLRHTYALKGRYNVQISGTYDQWGHGLRSETDCINPRLQRLVEVKSFGQIGLTQAAFCEVGNITMPLNDMPDPAKLTTATAMFLKAIAFNQPIGHWDMSKVTTMGRMFHSARAFNQELGAWDVSNVDDMKEMFSGSSLVEPTAFNQDLSNWKLKSSVVISHMFLYSGISETNFCKLKDKDVWKEHSNEVYGVPSTWCSP